jgi:hypothetical protein
MFRKLFGPKPPKALPFRLKYDPTPENAHLFAEDMVQATKKIDGRDLDYSRASLDVLDEVLEGFRADGTTADQVRETLFGFGCYLGEVIVRHAGGKWRPTGETAAANVESLPLVVELPSGSVLNPLGKVFKRVQLGPGENVGYFYDALTPDIAHT